MARLLSVNVGLPREVAWNGKTVRTAVWKFPIEGRRMVRTLNIDGDAQAVLQTVLQAVPGDKRLVHVRFRVWRHGARFNRLW